MYLRKWFLAAIAACMSFSVAFAAPADGSSTSTATARKPNVIVIVSDDHGYNEIGLQGGDIPTPQIDSIGRAGIRFSNGYVSCPVCSPTRAGVMTGTYQTRFGHELNPGQQAHASKNFGLPLTQTTFPSRMKELGYVTGMVGKWHLGYEAGFHPMDRGFDEFFGFLGGAHSYTRYANEVLRGREPEKGEQVYLTTAFGREARAFIEKHQKDPFFLYLAFNAVHSPLEAPQEYLDKFAAIEDLKRRNFAAMLSAMDDEVGSVLNKLRELKLEENTLVFFFSDNGGPTPSTTSKNDPLRGTKGTVYEGGVRVPFLAQWKGQLPAGKVYDQPVIALDVLPTAIAAAGGKAPAGIDGVNLLPYLKDGKSSGPHEQLTWRFGSQWAIRKGDWKLLRSGPGEPQLYNLSKDISETNDLAAAEPAKRDELQRAFDTWNKEQVPPLWQGKARFMSDESTAAKDVTSDTKADRKGKDAGKKPKAERRARRAQRANQ